MNPEEQAYLDLMSEVIHKGYDKPSRTGKLVRSLTGRTLRFILHRTDDDTEVNVLPLLTTKHVVFRLVASELLWFISGGTTTDTLHVHNNHIWDANASREFLDSRGLTHYKEGELGPIYGWQWRHWNGMYPGAGDGSQGIDQLSNLVTSIKNNPWSRRHILTAWNPEQLDAMALPPCHIMVQFVVRPSDPRMSDSHQPYWLDAIVYQRSADLPLGVPFNITSYALLTHMMAHVCGLHAGELVYNTGDVHIYHDQLPYCETQLSRSPYKWPVIEFENAPMSLDEFKLEHFSIYNYERHGPIPYPFSV